MSFWCLQFSQKTNKKIRLYYYSTSSRVVFVRFLGELKAPSRQFEINWALQITKTKEIFREIDDNKCRKKHLLRRHAFNFTNILINPSIFIPCKNISIVLQVTLPLTLTLAMCFSKDIECSFIVYNPIEFIVDVQKNVANGSMSCFVL